MIENQKREAIRALHHQNKSKKEIARLLELDPKTVRRILAEKSDSQSLRSDKVLIDPQLLVEIYQRCEGYVQRVYEVLREEHHLQIGYSTLTRMIRDAGIAEPLDRRCDQVPDVPGAEMQHDTTLYRLLIGGKLMSVICSGLYLRYSKMRYIKFYRSFNRFRMQCFLYEALCYWGYVARSCVIDNTNLAVYYGTGSEAVFNPEMLAFAKPYGFQWLAHEIMHANRKAGTERNFWTVETNFLPGRSFESMEDLNGQGFQWATDRYARRPLSKTRLIPIELFEQEKPHLILLPPCLQAPYQDHERDIDQYGHIAFEANYYWVPKTLKKSLTVLEFPGKIQILENHTPLAEYPLPASHVRNEKFRPEGVSARSYEPSNRKKSCQEEEKRLRALGSAVSDYLEFIRSRESGVRQKPRFIRDLYNLSQELATPLFLETIERAKSYRVTQIETLVRISTQLMKKDLSAWPEITIDPEYLKRDAYQAGRFSEESPLDPGLNLPDEKKDNPQDPEDTESSPGN